MTNLPNYLRNASAEDRHLFALESQLSEVRLAIAKREIAHVEFAILQALANDLKKQIKEIERARK